MLLEHLDDQQRKDWEVYGRFEVQAASGRVYSVSGSGVRAVDGKTSYCLEPAEGMYPTADVILARKLWLEADEEGFLAAANHFPDAPPRLEWNYGLERAQQEYQHRAETLHRRYTNEIANEQRQHHLEVEAIRRRCEQVRTGPPNCRCVVTHGLFLRTQEEARAYLESQNWEVAVSWDVSTAPPLPTYEVDGMASDEHTVGLLRQAAIERRPVPVQMT